MHSVQDELTHQNALLNLKLNKSVAEGTATIDGEQPAMSVFEKESIEAAAGAKARRESDDLWTEKMKETKEKHDILVKEAQNEVQAFKIKYEEAKETNKQQRASAMDTAELSGSHVKEVSYDEVVPSPPRYEGVVEPRYHEKRLLTTPTL